MEEGPSQLITDFLAELELDHECEDSLSDGYMDDFEISIVFLRPDGKQEYKDPNWVADCGYGLLAAAVFGSTEAWSTMSEKDKTHCSEQAVIDFHRLNHETWHAWYSRYEDRAKKT